MKSNKSGVTVTYEFDKWFDAPNQHDNDVVRVIRCKDCKWLGVANLKDKYGQPNPVPCCRGNGNIRIGIKPDDYCSRAERKEE